MGKERELQIIQPKDLRKLIRNHRNHQRQDNLLAANILPHASFFFLNWVCFQTHRITHIQTAFNWQKKHTCTRSTADYSWCILPLPTLTHWCPALPCPALILRSCSIPWWSFPKGLNRTHGHLQLSHLNFHLLRPILGTGEMETLLHTCIVDGWW